MKVFDEVLGKEVEMQRVITPEVGEEHPHEEVEPEIDYEEVLNGEL